MIDNKMWGLHTVIDLYSCDISLMTDNKYIKQFVIDLCEEIQMKRYGDVQIVRFGDNPDVSGYSVTQLIETSLISGHFVDKFRAIFLDIFSCAPYDPDKVIKFCVAAFKANTYNAKTINRGEDIINIQ